MTTAEDATGGHPDNPDSAAASSSSPAGDKGLPRSSTMPSGLRGVDKIIQLLILLNSYSMIKFLKKKLKMLNRIATVKDDGTVVADVPSSLETSIIDGFADDDGDIAFEEPWDGADIPVRPPMQIVILIVGTRGDVQSFVAIGKCLQDYGHRVRLASHANFKEFVLSAGLEFYPLGDMVKNKGFLPSGPSEIPIQRKQVKEIIFSLLPACKEPDPDTGLPFKVDAIIANPSAYGQLVNFLIPFLISYQNVDSMIWLGIRDMINEFRKEKLKLRPVTYLSGSQGSGNDIPHGYIWSPHLVPKPKVQDPAKMTEIIVKALEATGQRGIINKGWGGLGTLAEPKDFVYLLDNCPHDWLFLQCKAVVHHGGAGTTAAGLKAACPTTIVPFFGDQPFWGDRVHARGVGPPPIPVDQFNLQKLVDAINFMIEPEVKVRAVELAEAMESEDGVSGAVRAFLRHLPS
uniref:Uncharacterized protein n=1 Tax=Leersia perrieri TaxID=77586 RepID=A0A0D9W1Z5_9ORYZ